MRSLLLILARSHLNACQALLGYLYSEDTCHDTGHDTGYAGPVSCAFLDACALLCHMSKTSTRLRHLLYAHDPGLHLFDHCNALQYTPPLNC